MTIDSIIDPIVVVVSDGRYDCYSLHPEPTEQDLALMALLKHVGGVSDSVAEGTWHFSAELLDSANVVIHLEPAPK